MEFKILSKLKDLDIEHSTPDGNTFWDSREILIRSRKLDSSLLDFAHLFDQQVLKIEKIR